MTEAIAKLEKNTAAPAPSASTPAIVNAQAPDHDTLARLTQAGVLRPKLKVGGPNDPEERNADRMADRAMGGGGACCDSCAKEAWNGETLRMKPIGSQTAAAGSCASGADAIVGGLGSGEPLNPRLKSLFSLSGGRPIDRATRAFFEPRFGRDLSGVQIHTGPQAAAQAGSIAARAFTIGDDIVFGDGEYRPGTSDGNWLLAHELAHTMQTSPGIVRRDPLDPSNPQAWDWYASKGHRDPSFLQTVDRASKDAADVTKGLADAKAPTTDDEREAMDKRIEALIRLKAVGMVAAHRAELVKRKQKFEAMLAPHPTGGANQAPGTAPAVSEADRRADTVKAIRKASEQVIMLNAKKEQFIHLRDDIQAAVRLNAGPETIKEEFETLQKDAYPEPPKDLQVHVDNTGLQKQMRGMSWGTKKDKLFELRNYLVGVRNAQISGFDASIADYYESFPFLAEMSAEYILTGHKLDKTTRGIIGGGIATLLSPILGPVGNYLATNDKGKQLDDETLLSEVRSAFDSLLEKTDDAIAKVGSGGIEPLDLPGALDATRASLPAPLQAELDRMKEGHEVGKFTKEMAMALGIAVLAAASGGLAGIGLAGWAATASVGAAAIGTKQLADQAKDILDRQTLAAAATNPKGELLGVSAANTLEKVLFGVGVILTAVDLVGVLQEIRTLKPHFAEEPHFKGLAGEPGAELPKAGEFPENPQNATQFVNDHPETIVDGTPGQRRAELGGHEVVEIQDALGIHCEFHSPGGPSIPCPTGWGEPNMKGVAGQIHGADQYRGGQTILTAKLKLPNGDIEYVTVPNTGAGWRDLQEEVAIEHRFKPIEPSTPGSDLHAEENLQAYISSIEKQTGGRVTVIEWAISRGKAGTSILCKKGTCRHISSTWGPQIK